MRRITLQRTALTWLIAATLLCLVGPGRGLIGAVAGQTEEEPIDSLLQASRTMTNTLIQVGDVTFDSTGTNTKPALATSRDNGDVGYYQIEQSPYCWINETEIVGFTPIPTPDPVDPLKTIYQYHYRVPLDWDINIWSVFDYNDVVYGNVKWTTDRAVVMRHYQGDEIGGRLSWFQNNGYYDYNTWFADGFRSEYADSASSGRVPVGAPQVFWPDAVDSYSHDGTAHGNDGLPGFVTYTYTKGTVGVRSVSDGIGYDNNLYTFDNRWDEFNGRTTEYMSRYVNVGPQSVSMDITLNVVGGIAPEMDFGSGKLAPLTGAYSQLLNVEVVNELRSSGLCSLPAGTTTDPFGNAVVFAADSSTASAPGAGTENDVPNPDLGGVTVFGKSYNVYKAADFQKVELSPTPQTIPGSGFVSYGASPSVFSLDHDNLNINSYAYKKDYANVYTNDIQGFRMTMPGNQLTPLVDVYKKTTTLKTMTIIEDNVKNGGLYFGAAPPTNATSTAIGVAGYSVRNSYLHYRVRAWVDVWALYTLKVEQNDPVVLPPPWEPNPLMKWDYSNFGFERYEFAVEKSLGEKLDDLLNQFLDLLNLNALIAILVIVAVAAVSLVVLYFIARARTAKRLLGGPRKPRRSPGRGSEPRGAPEPAPIAPTKGAAIDLSSLPPEVADAIMKLAGGPGR